MNARNQFDRRDSLELGRRAELRFAKLARKLGWRVTPASKRQNIDEHWDFRIEKDGNAFQVEVKGSKRIRRGDDRTQHDLAWVELHGVRPGDPGWLFGQADWIAFERPGAFLLVRKPDLLKLINRKVDLVRKVGEPGQALYKIYSRRGRRDKLTLLPMEELESIKLDEWNFGDP